jgi:RNA polymerase sigma-70 factor (ECF subfamily)
MMLVAASSLNARLQARLGASDVVQETMIKAHRHFAHFHGQSEAELLAWLRQILVTNLANFVVHHVSTAKRDVRREISLSQFEADLDRSTARLKWLLPAEDESPSGGFEKREDAAVLAERLAELPSRYRQVLVMRNIQGLPFEEIAERLDRSPGSTRMLWLRAIEKLRQAYRRAGEHEH